MSWMMSSSARLNARPTGLTIAASWIAVHSSTGEVTVTGRSCRILKVSVGTLLNLGSGTQGRSGSDMIESLSKAKQAGKRE